MLPETPPVHYIPSKHRDIDLREFDVFFEDDRGWCVEQFAYLQVRIEINSEVLAS